ncbi:hypothetical protein AB0L06_02760 [Spirillospora sp. NPDC052269]
MKSRSRRLARAAAMAVTVAGAAVGTATGPMFGPGATAHAQEPAVPHPSGTMVPMLDCSTSSAASVTRDEALERAKVWVDENLAYDQGKCHSDENGSYRQDCSGFVSMAWHLPHSYVTWDFDPADPAFKNFTHAISWDELKPGDALVLNNANTEHIGLFAGWTDSSHTAYTVEAEADESQGTISEKVVRATDNYWKDFHPIRYNAITDEESTSVAQGWGVFANGNFHLVEPGSSGRLYQITSPSAGPWSSWEDMGGSSVGTPAIINRGSMYDLFATNADGEVMQRHYADSAWGSWYHDATASGNVTAAKGSGVAAVYGLDAYRLFYVGPGGDLFQSWYNEGWHSQSLGGDFVGTPAAAVSGDQVKVFATNSSGQVYQRNYTNGSWGGWYVDKTTNGPITAKAGTGVAAVHALGYDRLFYVGPGGDLFQSWYNDGWHSQSLGGSISGVPTVVMSGDDRMDVFGTSPAGGLFQRTSWAGGSWDSWHQIADKP